MVCTFREIFLLVLSIQCNRNCLLFTVSVEITFSAYESMLLWLGGFLVASCFVIKIFVSFLFVNNYYSRKFIFIMFAVIWNVSKDQTEPWYRWATLYQLSRFPYQFILLGWNAVTIGHISFLAVEFILNKWNRSKLLSLSIAFLSGWLIAYKWREAGVSLPSLLQSQCHRISCWYDVRMKFNA